MDLDCGSVTLDGNSGRKRAKKVWKNCAERFFPHSDPEVKSGGRHARFPVSELLKPEQRRWPRVRLSFLLRARPSQQIIEPFDEVLVSLNSCRNGCYFTTDSARYKKYMRLFIMFPYSDVLGAINRDYLGEVLRVEHLEDGRWGVAVSLLTSISLTIQDHSPTSVSGIGTRLGRIALAPPRKWIRF
jgi:hypothetical protein